MNKEIGSIAAIKTNYGFERWIIVSADYLDEDGNLVWRTRDEERQVVEIKTKDSSAFVLLVDATKW